MNSDLQFLTYLPHPALRPYIDYYWVVNTQSGQLSMDRPVTVAPITMHNLIFIQGDQPIRVQGLISKPVPRISLIGLVTENEQYVLTGNVRFISVRFKALGLYRFFHLAPSEFVNENVDFELYGKEVYDLYQRVINCPNQKRTIGLLDHFFRTQLTRYEDKEDRIRQIKHALHLINTTHGATQIKDIQKELKLSERGFRKSFVHTVGISPKLFTKITRFNSVFSYLLSHSGKVNIFELIVKLGYYDQSHFLKEFKQFTGSNFGKFKSNFEEFEELHRL